MKSLSIFFLALFSTFSAFSQCGLNQEQYTLELTTGADGSEISWLVVDGNNVYAFGINHEDNSSLSYDFCLPYGNYDLKLIDLQSNGWSNASYTLKKADGSVVSTGSGPAAMANTSSFVVGAAAGCQDFSVLANFSIPGDATVTNITEGDTVQVCWDINLFASGNYPNSGTDYVQSDATTTFTWNINGIGGPYTGANQNGLVIDDNNVHLVNLVATDVENCSEVFQFYVQNPSPNSYVEVTSDEDTICLGDLTMLHATYWNDGPPPTEIEEPDPVFLDDVNTGGGQTAAEYSSIITLSGYDPAETIPDSLCIEKICLNIEHSFMGDLTIHFVTPSSDTITLLEDQNGTGVGNGLGGTFFGEPIDPGVGPGVGYQYCWTPTATQTMHEQYPSMVTTFTETIDNGDGTFTNDYAAYPANPFSNAVGSSINGDWEIIVIDTWGSDDGYIFGWNFDLCTDQAESISYVDSFWVSPNYPTSIVDAANNSSSTEIEGVVPDGVQTYEYHVVDNKGCEWFGSTDVFVWDGPVTQPDFVVECDSIFQLGVVDPNTENPGYWEYVPDTINPQTVTFIPDNTNLLAEVIVPDTGVYVFEYHSFCGTVVTQTVTVTNSIWEVPEVDQNLTVFCSDNFTIGVDDINFDQQPGHWEYVAPPGGPNNVTFSPNNEVLNPDITVPGIGTYEFVYYNNCGRSDVQTVEVVQVAPILNVDAMVVCDFEFDIAVTNNIQLGQWTATGPSGTTVEIDDPDAFTTSATVDDYGTYTFTFTFDFCDGHFSQEVQVVQDDPEVSVADSYLVCNKTVQDLTADVEGQGDHWEVSGPGAVTFSNWQGTTTDATVTDYGTYTFYYYGCDGVDSIDVEFTQQQPLISAPAFVHCGTEAVIQVDYVGAPGTWYAENGQGESVPLYEIDDKTASLDGDTYDEYFITYEACDLSISTAVVFYCDLVIPNVFTPNNDGVNQEFKIDRLDTRFYDQSEFTVFNRWGKLVYHDGQYGLNETYWDGKDSSSGEDLDEGVYFFTLNLHNHVTGKDEKYSGSIHLFR